MGSLNPHPASSREPAPATVSYAGAIRYRECLRNHAASIGGHVLDGCCEFMPSSDDDFKCAACACHRSFHRIDGDLPPSSSLHHLHDISCRSRKLDYKQIRQKFSRTKEIYHKKTTSPSQKSLDGIDICHREKDQDRPRTDLHQP